MIYVGLENVIGINVPDTVLLADTIETIHGDFIGNSNVKTAFRRPR